jgi:hypothetical protein
MLGIIWFVQVIHYPLFAVVDDKGFAAYEKEHIRRTKYLIMPAMLIELTTAGLLIITASENQSIFWLNAAMLMGIWISTFFVQVPLHGKLSGSKSEMNIRRLVQSNWMRTILWSVRMVLLLWLIVFEL